MSLVRGRLLPMDSKTQSCYDLIFTSYFHSDKLKINKNRKGIGGGSVAGGVSPCAPFPTDRKGQDTPVWVPPASEFSVTSAL